MKLVCRLLTAQKNVQFHLLALMAARDGHRAFGAYLRACRAIHGARARRAAWGASFWLGFPNVVGQRIEKDTTDANGATEELEGRERLAEHECNTNNDDHALRSVGD